MIKPLFWLLAVFVLGSASCSQYTAVSAEQLQFLDTQERPLLLPDVTKRLGQTEIGQGPYYAYATTEKRTIEFWMLEPPDDMPPEGMPAEIAMVLERSPDGLPRIIWPRDLKGSNVKAAMKRFWPKMY